MRRFAAMVAGLVLAVSPAHGASEIRCAQRLAKASGKFVNVALKATQHCLVLRTAGKAPQSACRLLADSTGDAHTDHALRAAAAQLRKGLGACSDSTLAKMGFQAVCDGATTRADVERCLRETHAAAVEALLALQFPVRKGSSCGDGTRGAAEECDPSAASNGCDPDEVCVAAGSPDECMCVPQAEGCGNGTLDGGEECDPSAQPSGCPAGMACVGTRGSDACTCQSTGPGTCHGSCTPACGPGTHCRCDCSTPNAACGNGILDPGEDCDPGATPNGCAPGGSCASNCTCSGIGATTTTCNGGVTTTTTLPCDVTTTSVPGAATTTSVPGGTTTTLPSGATTTTVPGGTTTTTVPGSGGCSCGTGTPSRLSFTTSIGSGKCGSLKNDSGSSFFDLQCSGLYFGGAGVGVPQPATIPDQGMSLTKVSSCSGTKLTLGSVGASDSGSSARTCSAQGCLFGPPLPIPNPNGQATSTCVINTVARDAAGSADCASGASQIDLPLSSGIFLTGDLLPDVPGIQPCPICTGGSCKGGPNDGKPCTPADSASLGQAYPTSHDCPPPAATNLGALPIGFALTTGTASKTAVDLPDQPNVFCAFCKNKVTGAFKKPAVSCTSNSDCASVTGFTSCGQRTAGAFTANDVARTIVETGKPAGSLTDGAAHAATLVSVFCIPPTFNALVDSAADLPGPGAVGLAGQSKLLH